MNREQSLAQFQRAKQLMPGGVNSPARAFGAVGGEPLFIERAQGPHLFDIDGNQFIDYIGSWGPMILGHRDPRVVAAIESALANGMSYGAPTCAESELAELIVDAVPSIERVRLVNSGTEATMSAIRLARGFTGRDIIVKFSGNYHGHVDSLLVAAGSAAATLGVPNSPGVTAGTSQDTMVLAYNDVAGLEAAFASHGDKIAGVIMEPVVGNMGCVAASTEFLAAARRLTANSGAVLIFDEVMTGFRVAMGGAQERFNVTPDLTTLGKIVGGGMPIGAYGGRSDIMAHVLPEGQVFQAGTLSGNPIATAAGIATLKGLKEDNPYPRLEQLAADLAAGLAAATAKCSLPTTIQNVGSMLTLFFHPGPVECWADAELCDTKKFGEYFWAMLERGVYLPCSQYEALFISATHTDEHIATTVAAAGEVLAELG